MSLPICERCARGILLCSTCESLLASGRINVYDVEASRALFGLMGADADFTRAIDTENHVVIVAKDVGGVIGRDGRNLKLLGERLGKPVRVVGQEDLEGMAMALCAPARMRTISTVLKPGDGKKYRVHIEKGDRERLRLAPKDLQMLLIAATGLEIELIFD